MATKFTQADAIAYARKVYADPSDDDVEIDDKPRLSKVEDNGALKGYWVQAWVWAPNPNYYDQ